MNLLGLRWQLGCPKRCELIGWLRVSIFEVLLHKSELDQLTDCVHDVYSHKSIPGQRSV